MYNQEAESQFIVGIYKYDEFESKWEYIEDGFAIISDRSYGPVLLVRTKKNETECDNKYYLDLIITDNFYCEFKESDDFSGYTARFKNANNKIGIKFDSSSSQAFTEFKNQIAKRKEIKYKTLLYDSCNIQYSGQFNDDEGVTGEGTEFYDTHEQKVKYKGEFEDNLYDGSGIFYSYDGKLEIIVNNISRGIPNGQLKLVIHRKNKDDIIKSFSFRSLDIEVNIGDNNFCETIGRYFFKDLDTIFFEAYTLDEKVDELNKKMDKLISERELLKLELSKANKGIIQKMFGLLWN